MKEKYLPIGTVCRLKDGQKNLMVVGFAASAAETDNKMFDYIGVLHPEGVMSSDMNFLFNHDQIEEILFEGFVNEEEIVFKRRLTEFMINGTIDGQSVNMDGTTPVSSAVNIQQSVQPVNNNVPPQMF